MRDVSHSFTVVLTRTNIVFERIRRERELRLFQLVGEFIVRTIGSKQFSQIWIVCLYSICVEPPYSHSDSLGAGGKMMEILVDVHHFIILW